MVTSQESRIFDSGDATTLYATIPARVVADSQFPFEADDEIRVTISDGRLVITSTEDGSG